MPKIITPEMLAASGTEDGHQSALFCYAGNIVNERDGYTGISRGIVNHLGALNSQNPHAQLWALLYSIPNGGKRSGATASRMKATGTQAGFPDIGLPVARGGFHGLFIELKRPSSENKRKGIVQLKQEAWLNRLYEQGYCIQICVGWQAAIMSIEKYLTLSDDVNSRRLNF